LYGKPEKLEEHLANECLKTSMFEASSAIKQLKSALEQLLESNSTNLADCFIQLINLASLLSKLPSDNMVAFQQYAIKYFNNRWKGFDSDLYILSYFLHPAYRDLFDLDQFPLYLRNDNEFENEDELSEINESDENNSDLNKSQEEKDDDSSNYNYNIKELIAEMMRDNSDYSTIKEDQ
ncbi:17182_t:CDS:2, partial [Funneliformis geosporum]